MAFTDGQTEFSDAQNLTSTTASTNIYDAGADVNLGACGVEVQVEVLRNGSDSDETFQITLQGSDDTSFSGADLEVIADTGTITDVPDQDDAAVLVLKPSGIARRRYYRLNYTLGGTTPDYTFTAHLVPAGTAAQLYDTGLSA